jgi:hypothetical protein
LDTAQHVSAGLFLWLRNDRRRQDVSHLQIIERLCRMLDGAQEIIRKQAELLAMHGIETDSGKLERQRRELLADIERST